MEWIECNDEIRGSGTCYLLPPDIMVRRDGINGGWGAYKKCIDGVERRYFLGNRKTAKECRAHVERIVGGDKAGE